MRCSMPLLSLLLAAPLLPSAGVLAQSPKKPVVSPAASSQPPKKAVVNSAASSQPSKKLGINLEPDYFNSYDAQTGINNIGPASAYFNFGSSTSLTLPKGALYVPALHTLDDVNTQELNNAISYGNVLVGGNEPDHNGVWPQQWIYVWPQMMNTKLRLGSPAWTSDNELNEFMREANARKYPVGFITIHPYTDAYSPVNAAQSANDLINEVQHIHSLYPSKKIWPTEFGLAPWGSHFTGSDTVAFLQNALPRLEALPYVEHYFFWTLGYPYSQYAASTLLDYNTENLLPAGVQYASTSANANPIPIADGTYYLVPQNATGLRLDASGAGTTPGTGVDAWSVNGGSNQTWKLTNLGGSRYEIQPSYDTSLCLDVANGSSADGTAVDLWTPNGGSNQIWTASKVSGNVYTFSPQCAPGSKLDVVGRATEDGTPIDIWSSNGQTNQQWAVIAPPMTDSAVAGSLGTWPYYTSTVTITLTPAAGTLPVAGTYYTVDYGPQQTYSAPFKVSGDSAHSVSFWSVDTAGDIGPMGNQSFTLDTAAPMIANGNHTLTPQSATGSRLDATASGTTYGTAAEIWTANGNSNQSWTFTYLGGGQYMIQPSYALALNLESNYSTPSVVDLIAASAISGISNNIWVPKKVSGSVYTLSPLNVSGSCLDITGGGSADGTAVNIWPANGAKTQQWAIN